MLQEKKEEPWKRLCNAKPAGKTLTERIGKRPGNVAPIVGSLPRTSWAGDGAGCCPFGPGWNWNLSGDRGCTMRSPLSVMAALAAMACTGVSLAVSCFLPEMGLLSATAAVFWWQVVRWS